uniref:hypothetical protein n=1 Tax=Ferroglobus placidus TaxID=54261 RepID=UPI0001B74E3F|nr:hypothetical protein [Ferroglobus placidus]
MKRGLKVEIHCSPSYPLNLRLDEKRIERSIVSLLVIFLKSSNSMKRGLKDIIPPVQLFFLDSRDSMKRGLKVVCSKWNFQIVGKISMKRGLKEERV